MYNNPNDDDDDDYYYSDGYFKATGQIWAIIILMVISMFILALAHRNLELFQTHPLKAFANLVLFTNFSCFVAIFLKRGWKWKLLIALAFCITAILHSHLKTII